MAGEGRAGIVSILRSLPRAPATGTPGDPGLFGPGSAAWRINGETVLLLGGGRALLMQLAHPSVAAGVADHSDFPTDAYVRLWRTLDTTLTVTFGDAAQSRSAVERVNSVHRTVVGTTPAGEPYRAMDPDLLLWVHATLVDSALVVFRRFLGPLGPEEVEGYYREMQQAAVALGVRGEDLPPSHPEFEEYVRETIEGLRVSEQAAFLAEAILSPPVSLELAPAARLFRVVTAGLLPPPLRREYGIPWGRFDRWMLSGATMAIRSVLRVSPGIVRRWPHARWAERRVASDGRPT